MFEARYLMKWVLLHVLFSHFLSVILIFLFLKFYITFTISFCSEKNRSNVKTNFIFVCQRVVMLSETRFISTNSGIVIALALKSKMGNK